MFQSIRSRVYGALTDGRGDSFAPVRLAKSAALFANDIVGRPLASREEFAEREAFEANLAAKAADVAAKEAAKEAAPVVVFHIERLPNELKKITDILKGEGIAHIVRSIPDDEAAISAAKMDSNDARFPMVFIAGDFIGGVEALTNALTSGELHTRVYG